jgi:hypothetical protein
VDNVTPWPPTYLKRFGCPRRQDCTVAACPSHQDDPTTTTPGETRLCCGLLPNANHGYATVYCSKKSQRADCGHMPPLSMGIPKRGQNDGKLFHRMALIVIIIIIIVNCKSHFPMKGKKALVGFVFLVVPKTKRCLVYFGW